MKIEPNLPNLSNMMVLDNSKQEAVVSTPEIISQEVSSKNEEKEFKTGGFNPESLFKGTQEISNLGEINKVENVLNTEITSNTEEQVVDNPFFNTAQELVNKGVFDLESLNLDHEVVNPDVWDSNSLSIFIENVIEGTKRNLEAEVTNKATEDTFHYILEGMSDITRKGFEYEKNNPDPEDVNNFYRLQLEEYSIKSLNPHDSVDAEKIIIEFYKSIGQSAERAKEVISNLKDPIAEAVKVKPQLDKKIEQIAQNKITEQNEIMAYELQMKESLITRMNRIFDERDSNGINSLDGIPLDKKTKDFLRQVLVDDEVPMMIKGKKVTLSGAEALMMVHKHNTEKGNLKHLMKTIIYLNNPEILENTIIKDVRNKEMNRMIKENKESRNIKTGTNNLQLSKPKPASPKTGMVLNNR